MENSKLFTLLCTFSAKDWQQFGQYVRSPFFNQTDTLVALAGELENYLKESPEKGKLPRKKVIFQKLFPVEPYSDADFNRLCSRLLALATDFLAFQSWQEDGVMGQYYALRSLSARKLDKHFRFALQRAEQSLTQSAHQDIPYFQQRYLLAELAEWQFYGTRAQLLGPLAQKAAENFDLYLVAQKLQHLCLIASLNRLQTGSFQIQFAEELLAMSAAFQHVPLVAIYRHLYLMLTGVDAVPHFSHLNELVRQHEAILAQRELNMVYLALINFCIGRIRYGEKEYATPLLELYEKALEKGILMDKGVISPWTFKNVVKLGLGLQRFVWVEGFIRQYAPLLEEKERAEALHFNLADLYYCQKDFEKAQLHLREVEFSDVRYYLHGRILLAKIYYTTEAWEALDNLLSTFRIYLLRSKKLNRDEKRPYLNFISILEKLLHSLPEKRAKLREVIQQTSMLTDRTWLLEITGSQA